MKLRYIVLMIFAISVISCGYPADRSGYSVSNKKIKINASADSNAFTGFKVFASDKIAADVRFSSDKLITALKCAISPDKRSMIFTQISAKPNTGLTFAETDFIKAELIGNDPYPKISFKLNIRSFDPAKWQMAAGKQPFHFLSIFMPDAKVWHQCGWLNETPTADPFPLLLDTHVGSPELSAYHYNRNWSYTVPLGGSPVPVIGLWSPDSGQYAGLEFQSARLDDNSERDIAAGYCWGDGSAKVREPNPDQFVTLAYPHGGKGYQSLVFPEAGTVIQSYGRLLWSLDMSADKDPNRFYYNYVWDRYKNRLPEIPETVDLSWIPNNIKMQNFAEPNGDGRIVRGVEGSFQVPGSKQIVAWHSYIESEIEAAKKVNDIKVLNAAAEDAETLMSYVKTEVINGDRCAYWEKPMEGRWTDEWGGEPVKSIRNSDSFAGGRLLLNMYKHMGKTEYLDTIDGIFNWAKHIGWTRNEFADVPSSPFAIGSALSVSFLLDYHMAFKNAADKRHREMAKEAIDLVKTFMYRHMSVWMSDNNRYDNLDSAFLWEPTSGRDWTGAACSNEIAIVLNVLGTAAVHTGDPALMWMLQGSLSRFHILYQKVYKDSLGEYTSGNFSEAYTLYKGHNQEVGDRAPFGGFFRLDMLEPVGSASIRVLAGEKSAMAFNKNNDTSTISEYRYGSNGDLSFKLKTVKPAVDLSLTVPFIDISGKKISIIRDGETLIPPPTEIKRQTKAFWSVLIKNLRNGDRILVGDEDISGKILPDTGKLARKLNRTKSPAVEGFAYIPIKTDTKPAADWNSYDSWVGAPYGQLYSFGIPFNIDGEGVTSSKFVFNKPIKNSSMIALLYSSGTGNTPAIIFSDGSRTTVSADLESLAWRAWPPIFTAKLAVSVVDISGKTVAGIDPGSRTVWAATAISDAEKSSEIIKYLKSGASEWKSISADEQQFNMLSDRAKQIPEGAIALLPPSNGGVFVDMMQRSGIRRRSSIITPDQLVDSGYFNAKKFPVAIYSSGESYTHTVNSDGDGVEALVRYVNEGGILFAVSSGATYPFYFAEGPGFRRSDPLDERLGLPIDFVFESELPEELTIDEANGQDVLDAIPESFPYFAGDIRLRGIGTDRLLRGSKYTPIYVVRGVSGKKYADAAGLVELPNGKGKIFYIFGSIFNDRQNGGKIAISALRYMIDLALKAAK